MVKKVFTIGFLLLFTLSVFSTVVFPLVTHAQSTTYAITPSLDYFSVTDGVAKVVSIQITNNSNEDILIKPILERFIVTGIHGSIAYVPLAIDNLKYYQFDNNEFSVSSKKTTTFHFTIDLPKNFALGGLYDAVLFQEQTDNSNDNIWPRIASLLFITVNGKAYISGELHQFDISQNNNLISVSVIAENTGNVHIIPHLPILLDHSIVSSFPMHTLLPAEQLIVTKNISLPMPLLFARYTLQTKMVENTKTIAHSATINFTLVNIRNLIILILAFISVISVLGYFLYKRHLKQTNHIAQKQ